MRICALSSASEKFNFHRFCSGSTIIDNLYALAYLVAQDMLICNSRVGLNIDDPTNIIS